MKNDALKKHHFWILFGLVPLFVLIGVIVVSSSVGGAISTREAEIKKSETTIKSKSNPKPEKLITQMDELIEKVKSKKDGLWKECYTPQKSVYSTEAILSQLDEEHRPDLARLLVPAEKLKFGDKLPDDENQYGLFQKEENYRAWYKNLADKLKPTSFANGNWETVFRFVNSWTDVKLSSEQIWLILEDMWVQKSLMEAIASVNEQMSEFTRVKFERNGQVIDDPKAKEPNNPLSRKFRSRTWEVELEVVADGPKKYLKGRLINITDKLQLLGVGNTMTLKVWLESGDSKAVQPFEFKIGGEFVPGMDPKAGGDRKPTNFVEVVRTEDHAIPAGMTVSEIARVEQVFDARTVPIHVIQGLALGKQDSRNIDLPLQQPKFFPPEPEASSSGSGSPGMGGPGPGMKGSGGPVPTGDTGPKRGGGVGFGGPLGSSGGNQGAVQVMQGGGPVATVLDGNKKRYLEVTDQVRRMPVALSVVVDQSFLQDVLLALANSSLRFQITQVTWSRFRGNLDLGGPSGSPEMGGGVVYSGPAQLGSEFGLPGGRRPGSSGGPPGRPMMGPGAGGPGPGSFGFGGSRPAATVSESQLTSGLIELTVYGVVSLYASPEAAAADAGPKKDATPKDKGKDTAVPEPTSKDKGKDTAVPEPASKDKGKGKDPALPEPASKDKGKDTAPPGPASKDKGKDPASKEEAPAPMPKAPAATDPKTPKK